MSRRLLQGVSEQTPDLNPMIANGLALYQVEHVESYIDSIWKSAAETFPPELKYLGGFRLSPTQEFMEHTKRQNNKETLELSRSDFTLVGYKFQYGDNEAITRYVYLPFISNRGSTLYIRGRQFGVSPILADPAFSMGANNVFIQLTKMRITFERTPHHFFANGERETVYIVWSWLHHTVRQRNKNRKTGENSRVTFSTMANYLFAKFGVKETFKKFTGIEPIIGTNKDITVGNYPSDKWVICSTLGVRPKSWYRKSGYENTRVRMAIPKDKFNMDVKSLVGSFFYILDQFPLDLPIESIDDEFAWKVVLGYIIYGEGINVGLMVKELEQHMISIEEYMDFIVEMRLRRVGIHVDTIYDLFYYAMGLLTKETVMSKEMISSMYNKQLVILRYLTFDVVQQIFTLSYRIRAAFKKAAPNLPEPKAIETMFNRHISKESILKTLAGVKHPEVNPVSSSTDNIYLGITGTMIPQENASGNVGKTKINLTDPAKHLHASLAEVASYSAMSKADPTGRSIINPMVNIDVEGMIIPDPDFIDILESVQNMIRR